MPPRQVKTMDDLQGPQAARRRTDWPARRLKALGATAVPMPIPQVPESLAQRAIDGAVVPWEVVPAIKLHELVKYHTEIPGSPTLYTASFFLAMNKAKYDGLPRRSQGSHRQELRHEVRRAGRQHVGRCRRRRARDGQEARQHASPPSRRTRRPSGSRATEPVIDAWIKQVKDKGARRRQAARAGPRPGCQVR